MGRHIWQSHGVPGLEKPWSKNTNTPCIWHIYYIYTYIILHWGWCQGGQSRYIYGSPIWSVWDNSRIQEIQNHPSPVPVPMPQNSFLGSRSPNRRRGHQGHSRRTEPTDQTRQPRVLGDDLEKAQAREAAGGKPLHEARNRKKKKNTESSLVRNEEKEVRTKKRS